MVMQGNKCNHALKVAMLTNISLNDAGGGHKWILQGGVLFK